MYTAQLTRATQAGSLFFSLYTDVTLHAQEVT